MNGSKIGFGRFWVKIIDTKHGCWSPNRLVHGLKTQRKNWWKTFNNPYPKSGSPSVYHIVDDHRVQCVIDYHSISKFRIWFRWFNPTSSSKRQGLGQVVFRPWRGHHGVPQRHGGPKWCRCYEKRAPKLARLKPSWWIYGEFMVVYGGFKMTWDDLGWFKICLVVLNIFVPKQLGCWPILSTCVWEEVSQEMI